MNGYFVMRIVGYFGMRLSGNINADTQPRAFSGHPNDKENKCYGALEENVIPLDAGLAQSISVAIGDSDIASVVKGVAQRSGMEPAEVSQRVNSVVQTYQTQTDSHLGKLGIPAGELPEFYEFCKQSQNKSALRTVIQDQM